MSCLGGDKCLFCSNDYPDFAFSCCIPVFHKTCLNLALTNFVEQGVKHAEISLRGPYLIDREMCIMVYCPFCNAYLKLVLTDDPLDIQRVVFLRGGGDEGKWNVDW